MSYLGNSPTSQNFLSGSMFFSGNGTTTAFTLNRSVSSTNDILVMVGTAVSAPNTYTVSGTTLTFTTAPASGTNNICVRYLSTTTFTVDVSDQSVNTAKIQDGVVTAAKLHTTAVTDKLGYTPLNKAGDSMVGGNFALSSFISLQTTQANGYPRINGAGSSAQLGLFRSSGGAEGGMYVGANADEFAVWDSGFTRRLIVDQSGRVTMPNQPAMLAQPNANGTVAVTTGATVYGWNVSGGMRFNRGFTIGASSLFGTNKKFDAENTGRITVPVAGVYSLYFDMRCEAVGGSGQAGVWVNGTQYIRRHIETWDTIPYSHCVICATFSLQANDYLEMGMWWNSEAGGPLAGYSDTVNWMSLIKIA